MINKLDSRQAAPANGQSVLADAATRRAGAKTNERTKSDIHAGGTRAKCIDYTAPVAAETPDSAAVQLVVALVVSAHAARALAERAVPQPPWPTWQRQVAAVCALAVAAEKKRGE